MRFYHLLNDNLMIINEKTLVRHLHLMTIDVMLFFGTSNGHIREQRRTPGLIDF